MTDQKILIKTVGGEPMLSVDALALLFGVDAELIDEHMSGQASGDGPFAAKLPAVWLKAGRRRASEAAAATGSRDMLSSLRYWAAQRGMTLVEVDE